MPLKKIINLYRYILIPKKKKKADNFNRVSTVSKDSLITKDEIIDTLFPE